MTVPMIVILCWLGNWQVERLHWKLDIIQKLEDRYGMPAVNLPVALQNIDNWEYRHVTVSGRFFYVSEMPLYSVGPTGKPGYDLFTPFLTNNGVSLIVNRGWVPEDLKDQISRPDTIKSQEITLTGVLRKDWIREKFAPENDIARNLWYFGDLEAMAKAKNLDDVYPMFLYVDKSSNEGDYPIGGRTRLNLVNNHLDYAMTWYGLALVLFVIYLIFNIRKVD
ncbi:MAG: SURF1 family protein [Emcibacter sp.]|nr:SURF1 family protein [Emcibacter sp.]